MRRLLALPLFFLLCHSASAQSRFSIRVGPDFAHQVNAYSYGSGLSINNYNSQSRTGFQAGWLVDIEMGGSFFFRQQLLYTTGGGKIPQVNDVNGSPIIDPIDYSLKYIQLPLQILYSPSVGFGRPWIGIGPYGGFLLGGTIRETGTDNRRPVDVGGAANDDFKRYDLGISPTAGIAFNNGLMIGMDYQIGLINVSNSDQSSGSSVPKTKNAIWSVYLGYAWKL
jgi:hypothetical protein